nr:integrase, catalytic region, zinc finger, CCHC-type, peptidase aspartic, catalytic [Tanacetum cinerariifolium]
MKLIQKLRDDQKCMKKVEPSSRSKTIEDIISIGSFMETLVLNHYVLVRKILNYSNVRRYDADQVNVYLERSITKLIFKGAVILDVVSYQFHCALNHSKLLIQKLRDDQKCMKKVEPSSRPKTIEDIISIGSFVEALVLNHYVLVRKILTKQSIAVPISTRERTQTVNQSVATSFKKTVATDSTRLSYSSSTLVLKHMTGNLKLLTNFVEKFLGTVKFGNDQIARILGYGDLVQGTITIKRGYYVKGLNHNLFSVGQFCDADLKVAFRKSTCYIRDLKENDLFTGVIPPTNVSRPQLNSNQMEDRVILNNSQGKKQEVEYHRRNVKFSKNKTSVTACATPHQWSEISSDTGRSPEQEIASTGG